MSTRFTVVIPFYNEASFLPDTLQSWRDQSRPPDELVLVDNGSTDDSVDTCRRCLEGFQGTIIHAADERPGKINALETGCSRATGDYVALSDADTYYPPHYLALAAQLIQDRNAPAALMALGVGHDHNGLKARLKRHFYASLSHIVKKQCFTGGYGQIIRSEVLEEAGGFSEQQWPYVLLDHEVMHRVLKYGDSVYHVDLWCVPSSRRSDRSAVRWTLFERFLYFVTPFQAKDWFFYTFLGPRLRARGMTHLLLRDKSWE